MYCLTFLLLCPIVSALIIAPNCFPRLRVLLAFVLVVVLIHVFCCFNVGHDFIHFLLTLLIWVTGEGGGGLVHMF